MNMIEVRELRKSYGGHPVVRGIDLDVAEGEVFGILGPNGAGKTTTVEMIGGLRARDGGDIRVRGLDPALEDRQLRELLGIQLQEARQPGKITVREALDLYRTFYRNPRDTTELLERFGLDDKADTRFEHLSGGQQQRLSVALALVGNPQVAILDELTTGLDPAARREIWHFLQDLVLDGLTILLVTHSMEEAQYLCGRVAILADGKIVAKGRPEDLAHSGGPTIITFTLDAGDIDGLQDLRSVAEVTVLGNEVRVSGLHDNTSSEVVSYLSRRGTSYRNLRVIGPSLDDAYVTLTGKETPR